MANIEIPQPNSSPESSLVRSSTRNSLFKNDLNKEQPANQPSFKGKVKKKELTFQEKLKRSFVKEDLTDIRDYVIFDVIVPSIKKGIFDTIVGAAGQLFGISVPTSAFRWSGASSSSGYDGRPKNMPYRDYTSIDRGGRRTTPIYAHSYDRYDRFYIGDYPFDYREDAVATIERMMDICDSQHGWVSVADFFNIVDPDSSLFGRNPYTNYNYGWPSMDSAVVESLPDGSGYYIAMPPARSR